MEEKRRSKRVSARDVQVYRIVHKNDREEEIIINNTRNIDISEMGMQLECTQTMGADDKMHILFALPPRKRPIGIRGKVAWSKELPEGKGSRIGIEFVEFDEEHKRKLLHDYIMMHPE